MQLSLTVRPTDFLKSRGDNDPGTGVMTCHTLPLVAVERGTVLLFTRGLGSFVARRNDIGIHNEYSDVMDNRLFNKRLKELNRLWTKKNYYRLLSQLDRFFTDDPTWLSDEPEWHGEALLWKQGWARLHHSHASSSEFKQAQKELGKALKMNPSRSSIVLFEKYSGLKWGGEAAKGELDTYCHLLKAGQTDERYKLAVRYAQVAVDNDPDCVTAQYRLALHAGTAGEFMVAVRAYSAVLERFPSRTIYRFRINYLWHLNDHEGIVADVNTVLAMPADEKSWQTPATDEAGLLVWRGNALVALERYEEAKSDFSRAIELTPKMASVYVGLGHLYRVQGDSAKMHEVWKLASEIGSNEADLAIEEYS